jgi:hypothetical protein
MDLPMRRPFPLWLVVVLCMIAAPLIGVIDFQASEVQPAVLLLFAGSAAISWLQPKYAWLVALLLGLSIVETHFVALAIGKTPPSETALPTLLALIPAGVGAVIGAGLRAINPRAAASSK